MRLRCGRCKRYKASHLFYTNKNNSRGYDKKCKRCRSKESVEIWKKLKHDPEDIAYREKWREENREYLNARAREWYRKNAEKIKRQRRAFNRAHKERNRAHNKVRKAIMYGRMTKPTTCEVCHKEKRLEGHHYKGYDFPLDVMWVCRPCHRKVEGLGEAAKSNHSILPAQDSNGTTSLRGGQLGAG